MKLTLETEFEVYVTEFKNADVSFEQLWNAFKGMLIILTWSEQTINQEILNLAEELTVTERLAEDEIDELTSNTDELE